jgi:hypothetical protein
VIPHVLLVILLGWCERERSDVIAFLREENRALEAQIGLNVRCAFVGAAAFEVKGTE